MKQIALEEFNRLDELAWQKIHADFVDIMPEYFHTSSVEDRLSDLTPEVITGQEHRRLAIRTLFRHLNGSYSYQVMHLLGRWFYFEDWYKGDTQLRHESVDKLLDFFKQDRVWHGQYVSDFVASICKEERRDVYEAQNSFVRAGVSFSLEYMIQPRLKVDRDRYMSNLCELISDRCYGCGRESLIVPFSRMASEEVIPTLLQLLDDPDVLHEVIPAIARLKVKAAIPPLEKIISGKGFDEQYAPSRYLISVDKAMKALKKLRAI